MKENRKNKIRSIVALSLVMVLMTSCSSKRNTGGIVAGLLGAVIGGSTGKNTEDRLKRAAVGGALLGIIGSTIGRYLDSQDEADLAKKTAELLNQNQNNTTWKSSHSGAIAELTVVNEYTKEVKETVVYEDSSPIIMEEVFEEQKPMVMNNISLGKPIGSAPVRSINSSRSYEQSAKVTRGTTARKNRVTRSSENRVKVKRTTRESKPKTKRVTRERTVMVQRKCKDVTIAVKLPNGQRSTETVQTCQGKNGLYGV